MSHAKYARHTIDEVKQHYQMQEEPLDPKDARDIVLKALQEQRIYVKTMEIKAAMGVSFIIDALIFNDDEDVKRELDKADLLARQVVLIERAIDNFEDMKNNKDFDTLVTQGAKNIRERQKSA